ncbi:MAG: isochorismatase family protein [Isosphaeraceae bacterium]|nr:isochorismatase family protein [Isosphaeraceae bacterium]
MTRLRIVLAATISIGTVAAALADEPGNSRIYENRIAPVRDPRPILADHPRFVAPIRETARFESPVLVDDPGADLEVRTWRFSYNARGIIEIPQRLDSRRTAIIVVHPWGIDDGSGWRTPEPAGAAFQCTPDKNAVVLEHASTVIDPFLRKWRPRVGLVGYSLPGKEDPIRKSIYRSVRSEPDELSFLHGGKLLADRLARFDYRGSPLPAAIDVRSETPTIDYLSAFPGLDAGPKYDPPGFWELPVPVMKPIEVFPTDYVFYDAEGYEAIRDLLRSKGIRHVLLAGYNTDMCVCSTTAGYRNLQKDFDVFLVGDATIATFPAQPTPANATNAAVAFASLNLFITQVSWVVPIERNGAGDDEK